MFHHLWHIPQQKPIPRRDQSEHAYRRGEANPPHIGVDGATSQDGATGFWYPLLDILEDLLVDLLVSPGGVEARLCQTRSAMLVDTPFVHSKPLCQ